MTVEKVLTVGELHVKEFVIDGHQSTTDGIAFKDDQGFTVARLDSSGNLHIRGGILTDL
jgi:hypothetical protein